MRVRAEGVNVGVLPEDVAQGVDHVGPGARGGAIEDVAEPIHQPVAERQRERGREEAEQFSQLATEPLLRREAGWWRCLGSGLRARWARLVPVLRDRPADLWLRALRRAHRPHSPKPRRIASGW